MLSAEPVAIFTRSWSLYDLITEHNYMFHREIYAGVGELLRSRADRGEYRLLDLGCGNARYLAPCLKRSPPLVYEGLDLSGAALTEAKEYLAGLPGEINLIQGELLQTIESANQAWDVIFSGFAIHHLNLDEKARFFQAAERCLSKEGWLILVDVVREENEAREDFLKGYLNFMREKWTGVPPEQLEEACAHVRDHDYPECLSTLRRMAGEAGLRSTRLGSRHAQHHTLLFSRNDG